MDITSYRVFYRGGMVSGIMPPPPDGYDERDYTYCAVLLNIDGLDIDLRILRDVALIRTDISFPATMSPVSRLDYTLRFQAENLRRMGLCEQSIEVLRKSCAMMEHDLLYWKPPMFFRLAEDLFEDGRDQEAEAYIEHLRVLNRRHYDVVVSFNATYLSDSPYQAELRKRAQEELYIGFEDLVRAVGKKRRWYRLVCENVPELAPKSLAAFSRMRNAHTKRYLEICSRMSILGYAVPE